MDFWRNRITSSRLVIIAGRLSLLFTRNLLTALVVSELSLDLKSVFAMMFRTSFSVCWSVSSKKTKPLRVVMNDVGGGVNGMKIVVVSFVEMNR